MFPHDNKIYFKLENCEIRFFFKFKVWKIKSINYDVSIDILLQNAGEASLDSSGSPNTQIWP